MAPLYAHQHSRSHNSSNLSAIVPDPPWSGWIETTGDALIILEAARRGLIPRVTRRLVDAERKMITSGSVFVFDEEESGIKRWTDGLFWSASRILGNFLLYRETDKRGAGHKTSRSDVTPEDVRVQDGSRSSDAHSLSRPRSETSRLGIDRQRERSLVGSLTNNEKFKQGGMVKKTFSLTINGIAQHLISYYKIEDIEEGRLRPPSSYPELAALDISAEFLDKTHFRLPPRVEVGYDGVPRYRGDADDIEPSPHVISAALGATPLLSEPLDVGVVLAKRGKRYEPYVAPACSGAGKTSKRERRAARGSRSQPNSPASDTPGPFSATADYALDSTYGMQAHSSYASAGYGGASQYGYATATALGYAAPPTLPPPPPMLPPPMYQPSHTTPATDLLGSGSPQAAAHPLQQSTYASPAPDAQYYPAYFGQQTSFAWSAGAGALPPYSQAAHHALPALLGTPGEKADGELHHPHVGFGAALPPVIQS